VSGLNRGYYTGQSINACQRNVGNAHTVERIVELQTRKSKVERHMTIFMTDIPESCLLVDFKGIGMVSTALILGGSEGFT
jgi:hypothetical protein